MLVWITSIVVLLGIGVLYDAHSKKKHNQIDIAQHDKVSNDTHMNDALAESNIHIMREQNQTNGLL